jgi:hypothetical protein
MCLREVPRELDERWTVWHARMAVTIESEGKDMLVTTLTGILGDVMGQEQAFLAAPARLELLDATGSLILAFELSPALS